MYIKSLNGPVSIHNYLSVRKYAYVLVNIYTYWISIRTLTYIWDEMAWMDVEPKTGHILFNFET